MKCFAGSSLVVFLLAAAAGRALQGQGLLDTSFFDQLDHPAIAYATRQPNDPIARVNRKIRAGEISMAFDPASGYLRSTLDALGIPIESQIAVFSQSSLQARNISPDNPRTIFFNDATAVAWMRRGFIEVASQDPTQGAIFYVLPQQETPTPQFVRLPVCMNCHHSYATLGVPGMLVRSLGTLPSGAAVPQLGNYVTDHRSPFEERWGGWYVTGAAGALKHMGRPKMDFDASGYLSSHSDIAALMVFDHQMRMMNLLTRIGWETRVSADAERLREHAKELVDYLLFVDEPPLPGRVQGSSAFAHRFAAAGPRDSKGRSLRDLDLERRLLRYPCSYMVYSEAFQALPAEARTAIYARIREVLTGRDRSPRYDRLSAGDRQAILEILAETTVDFRRSG